MPDDSAHVRPALQSAVLAHVATHAPATPAGMVNDEAQYDMPAPSSAGTRGSQTKPVGHSLALPVVQDEKQTPVAVPFMNMHWHSSTPAVVVQGPPSAREARNLQ